MQALGNDFIIIQEPKYLNKDLRKLCDRHFGIGADGVIFILPSKVADFRMRIFNSDGSEAEMCGNGIRCLAKYAFDKGLTKRKVISFETKAGIIITELILRNKKVKEVKVDMGEPKMKRKDIPMLGNQDEEVINSQFSILNSQFSITCVSVGNPHCVLFVDDIEKIDVAKIGSSIEKNKVFPNRINVEFVKVLNKNEIKVRVWERGVGETYACGTGACASVVASVLNNFTERKVIVHLIGGKLDVFWDKNNHIYLTGEAKKVFEGNTYSVGSRQ